MLRCSIPSLFTCALFLGCAVPSSRTQPIAAGAAAEVGAASSLVRRPTGPRPLYLPGPVVPQDPAVDARDSGRPVMIQPFPSTSAQVGAAWIPWAKADFSPRTRVPGAPSARLADGEGWAMRLGRYDDGLGSELVFSTTTYDDHRTGAELQTYSGYVDLTDRWELTRGPVFLWAGVGFGLGLIYFDWDRDYKSELTGLWQGEGILALQLGPNASIEARVMGFWAAHPGRDAGTGVTTMIGGSIGF